MSYAKTENGVVNYAGLHIDAVAATAGYMIIDLSDTTNWGHQQTGHIDLCCINVVFNPGATFDGHVDLGFLANVDASNGDLYVIKNWTFDSGITSGIAFTDYVPFAGGYFHCGTQRFFGYTHANDVLFQTDVNLIGPPGGAAAYPSGNGDLVLRVDRTAGSLSIGILVGYISKA